jgi:PAS domain S-box-containing protein
MELPVSAPRATHPRSGKSLTAFLIRYSLAALAIGLAVLLMAGLRELAATDDARPALLLAVAVSALYLGLGPALFSLALATFVAHDPVVLLTGAVLAGVCASFRGRTFARPVTPEPDAFDETVPEEGGIRAARVPGRTSSHERGTASAPPLELTSEATWRFRHEQPLDITLPEDEQVEHLYLYSVLAECNDAFARMYGFRAAADVVGTRLVVFLPPSNPENVAYLRRYIRSGYRLEDAESQEIDRYGRTKFFVNNLVGIFERGQLVGSWGTQRDVTEQRREHNQEYDSRLHSTKSSSQ